MAALAKLDQAYAVEIVSLRKAVQDIAATPEGAVALARFNAGDEEGALAILDDPRKARDVAAARRIATPHWHLKRANGASRPPAN